VPKRRVLGCSFPVFIVVLVVFLGLFVVGFLAGPLGKEMVGDLGLPEWLSVSKPHPELPAEEVFHIFGFPITNSIIAAWVTIIVLVGFSYAVTRRMRLIPGRLQAAFEFLLGWLYDLCQSVAGEENGRRFFPIVTTIFLFVGFNAWLGLLPGYGSIIAHTAGHEVHLLRPANTDINMPLAFALFSFVFVVYYGLRMAGMGFIRQYFNFGPFFRSIGQLFKGKFKLIDIFSGAITAFTGFLELLSLFIRVISLTFRLFGNMTAGEILLLIAMFLIPWLFALPFYGLELLIGFIQAIIFGGLTLIFLTLAVASHGEEAH
jgi:F-type H+-transporting ATPase subunit a